MKIKLIFDDWRQIGKADSIYCTELGCDLTTGNLHSGSTFNSELNIFPKEMEEEIIDAMRNHKAYPVFRVIPIIEE